MTLESLEKELQHLADLKEAETAIMYQLELRRIAQVVAIKTEKMLKMKAELEELRIEIKKSRMATWARQRTTIGLYLNYKEAVMGY